MPWMQVSPEWWEKSREIEKRHGLTSFDESVLMTYKTERDRGLLHTEEWRAKMAELQARFDQRDAEVKETFKQYTSAS